MVNVSDAGSRAGPQESYLSPGESREGKKDKGRGREGRRREAGPVFMDSLCSSGKVAESGRGLSSFFLCNYQNS